MKCIGIRVAKARLCELARAAAKGEVTILTDYGEPIATIAAIEQMTGIKSTLSWRGSSKPDEL